MRLHFYKWVISARTFLSWHSIFTFYTVFPVRSQESLQKIPQKKKSYFFGTGHCTIKIENVQCAYMMSYVLCACQSNVLATVKHAATWRQTDKCIIFQFRRQSGAVDSIAFGRLFFSTKENYVRLFFVLWFYWRWIIKYFMQAKILGNFHLSAALRHNGENKEFAQVTRTQCLTEPSYEQNWCETHAIERARE